MKKLISTSLLSTCLFLSPAMAEDSASNVMEILSQGTAKIDARYRYETVDEDGVAEDAKASTLRIRASYETPEFEGFSGLFEFEMIEPLGDDDYNSTTNGKGQFPIVADPDSSEVNQAYLQFTGIDNTTIRAGRQTIKRGNVRFVGDVGWRQNNQTFDGITIANTSIPDTEIHYGYIYNVNRVFSDDNATGNFNGDIHSLDITYKGFQDATLMGYGLLIDLENGLAVSSQTFGASVSGAPTIAEGLTLPYRAEYAVQNDYGDNPTDYSTDYIHVNAGLSYQGLTVKAGAEILGSDNGVGFSTPLATLHKFNGWADKFLATPANGLEDLYVKASYKAKDIHPFIDGTKVMLAYHDFSAENGGADYGEEFDFDISRKFMDHYLIGLRYADYDADQHATDTEKLIFTLGAKF